MLTKSDMLDFVSALESIRSLGFPDKGVLPNQMMLFPLPHNFHTIAEVIQNDLDGVSSEYIFMLVGGVGLRNDQYLYLIQMIKDSYDLL